jgi:hypothetical protein
MQVLPLPLREKDKNLGTMADIARPHALQIIRP